MSGGFLNVRGWAIARNMAVIGVSSIVFFASCKNDDAPDVSAIKIELTSKRLDSDIRQIDTNKIDAAIPALQQKYQAFLSLYINNILPFVPQDSFISPEQKYARSIGYLLTDPDQRALFDTVAKHFPDTKKEEEGLKHGFQYMKYYYPEYKVPEIIYFISSLNRFAAITYRDSATKQNLLGIGLDMFLGEQYPYYASVGIPQYMSRRLRPEYMNVNVFRAIYEDMHPFEAEGQKLIDMMVQKGKEQYFLKKILPFEKDEILFGFTPEQMTWCNKNEVDIYNFFIKENLLYESNWQKVLRYVNDAPNSSGMPAESPGNIGSWLGYRIVSAYMQQHPKTRLDELLSMNDAQKMLVEAKYKPR